MCMGKTLHNRFLRRIDLYDGPEVSLFSPTGSKLLTTFSKFLNTYSKFLTTFQNFPTLFPNFSSHFKNFLSLFSEISCKFLKISRRFFQQFLKKECFLFLCFTTNHINIFPFGYHWAGTLYE